MPEKRPHTYSVEVTAYGGRPKSWAWEIRRIPPLGVMLTEGGFATHKLAKLAGEKALHQLLQSLASEQSDT